MQQANSSHFITRLHLLEEFECRPEVEAGAGLDGSFNQSYEESHSQSFNACNQRGP